MNSEIVLINETHLGTGISEDQAREMIRILRSRGFNVAYDDLDKRAEHARELDANTEAIPDDVWKQCLQEAVATVQ